MIGTILKLTIFIVIVLVGLKIFMPEMADKAVNQISETTGVEKSIINDNLNKVTNIAIDKTNQLADDAKDKLKETKDRIND